MQTESNLTCQLCRSCRPNKILNIKLWWYLLQSNLPPSILAHFVWKILWLPLPSLYKATAAFYEDLGADKFVVRVREELSVSKVLDYVREGAFQCGLPWLILILRLSLLEDEIKAADQGLFELKLLKIAEKKGHYWSHKSCNTSQTGKHSVKCICQVLFIVNMHALDKHQVEVGPLRYVVRACHERVLYGWVDWTYAWLCLATDVIPVVNFALCKFKILLDHLVNGELADLRR